MYEKEELEGGWTAFLTARTDVGIVTWRRFMRSLSLCKRMGLHHKIHNNTLTRSHLLRASPVLRVNSSASQAEKRIGWRNSCIFGFKFWSLVIHLVAK